MAKFINYERLIYENENGGAIEFSVGSDFYVNVSKDVNGIADIRNTLYTSSSMGQHGETFISQKINSRDIDIAGVINRKDKDNMLTLRRAMQKILNPELNATLTYIYGDFVKVIDVKDGKLSLSIIAVQEKDETETVEEALDEPTEYSDGDAPSTGLGSLLAKLKL